MPDFTLTNKTASKRWSESQLSTIGAQDVRFPEPTTLHWQDLRKTPQKVRELLRATNEVLTNIENDVTLSPEGKKAQAAAVATAAKAELEKLAADPGSAVSRRLKLLEGKINEQLAQGKPKDVAESQIASEIRAHLAKQESPVMAALKMKDNPKVIDAVLSAPSFLTNMSDSDVGTLRSEVVKGFSEGAEIRQINEALGVGQGAIKAAAAMISERAGLNADPIAKATAAAEAANK